MSTWTDEQITAVVSVYATNADLAWLSILLSPQVSHQDSLDWTGSLTSSGWTFSGTGTINNVAATITDSGQLDRANSIVTWTTIGTAGSNVISGNSSFTLDPGIAQIFAAGSIGILTAIGTVDAILGANPGEATQLLIHGSEAIDTVLNDDSWNEIIDTTSHLFDPIFEGDDISASMGVDQSFIDGSTDHRQFKEDISFSCSSPCPGAGQATVIPEPNTNLFCFGGGAVLAVIRWSRSRGKRG
jgi:hypothetical protein